MWGATSKPDYLGELFLISIHAPRVGSDQGAICRLFVGSISIHAPRVGSDPSSPYPVRHTHPISIHAPRVGSDPSKINDYNVYNISIHAPRVGSDLPAHRGGWGNDADFNPRSPCGERLEQVRNGIFIAAFQSTLPVWGATANALTP